MIVWKKLKNYKWKDERVDVVKASLTLVGSRESVVVADTLAREGLS